jgi:hypothetical protein
MHKRDAHLPTVIAPAVIAPAVIARSDSDAAILFTPLPGIASSLSLLAMTTGRNDNGAQWQREAMPTRGNANGGNANGGNANGAHAGLPSV